MANIEDQLKTVSQKAEHVKASIYQAIHKEYADLFPSKSQPELLKAVKPLLKDIQKIEEKFENEIQPKVNAATMLHKDLLREYENTKVITDLLEKLCTCHRELTASKCSAPNHFIKAAKHLQVVKEKLDSVLEVGCDVKIFKVVRNAYIDQQTKLMKDITDAWSSLIKWNTSTSVSWDSIDGHLKTSLRVEHSVTGAEFNVVELITGMDLMHMLNRTLKTFSQKVYTYLVKPLVKFHILQSNIESRSAKTHVLKITKKGGSIMQSKSVQHANLYAKVLSVVQFLKTSLFEDFHKDSSSNVDIKPMALIGSFMWKELSEMIITEYLAVAVPNSNSQLEKYESTIEETVKFEEELVNLGFVQPGTDVLSKYVKDVNVHFANKVCQDILSEARELMMSEIHNMIEVDRKTDRAAMTLSIARENVLTRNVKEMLTGVQSIGDDYLNMHMFAFPYCRISDSVQKLMDHVYQKMVEATESPFPLATQILYSCRDVFELFVNVVPTYHRDNLKLPQMSALHYNNCMYLAHHCITLGHQFRSSLPGQLNSTVATFVDFVPVLRKCGTECFLEQLRTQQRELLCMLETCNNFNGCTSAENEENIKRAFNQIIHHLSRVAKQWDGILPVNIFQQSVAVLLNTVLESIISSILKMEDFSTEEAGQLHALFTSLIERCPDIIQSCSPEIVDAGINNHVRSWLKFEAMTKLMEGSLQEVVDLWNSGEGELATAMNEGEVRTLIRALFQNTDRRSQALSKIKHKQEKK